MPEPASRRLSPLPWRIKSGPRRSSTSVSFSANASEIRSPARHNTATSARPARYPGIVAVDPIRHRSRGLGCSTSRLILGHRPAQAWRVPRVVRIGRLGVLDAAGDVAVWSGSGGRGVGDGDA